jgi:hypothetical protein
MQLLRLVHGGLFVFGDICTDRVGSTFDGFGGFFEIDE